MLPEVVRVVAQVGLLWGPQQNEHFQWHIIQQNYCQTIVHLLAFSEAFHSML